MPLSERYHYVQVVLKTIDHLWHHQVTGLVILRVKGEQGKGKVYEMSAHVGRGGISE